MILDYTITADDRHQARKIYDSALAPMRRLTEIAQPFSFAATGFGMYCYAIGNRALAFSLFVGFGYLFSKGLILRFFRNLMAARRRLNRSTSSSRLATWASHFLPSALLGGSTSSLTSWLQFQGSAKSNFTPSSQIFLDRELEMG